MAGCSDGGRGEWPGSGDHGALAWTEQPAWVEFVRRVLDRRDRTGRFPQSVTCPAELAGALQHCVPPAAFRRSGAGKLIVDLRRVEQILASEARDRGRDPLQLETLFDRIAGRSPRDLQAEASEWRARLDAAVRSGVEAGRACAQNAGGQEPWIGAVEPDRAEETRAWLDALPESTGWGWRRLAHAEGFEAVRRAAAWLAAGFVLARHHQRGSLRLDHLSLAVAGGTKALRPGSHDHIRLARALLAADAELAAEVRAAAPASEARQRRLALERLGIVANDAPLEVLLQGPLQIEVEGHRLEDVARLAELQLPAKLTYGLVRRGRPSVPAGTRIVTVENESAFCTLAAWWKRDLVIFTGGQSSWSLVMLLRRLFQGDRTLRFFHAGDLDRSGVLILRSLRGRTGLAIEPLWMDAQTFDRCRDLSIAMTPTERERTRRLAGAWREDYCSDLLGRLAEGGRWLEQEAVLLRVEGLSRCPPDR